MANKKSVGKIMALAGIVITLAGFTLTQLHIPLTKEESQALFQNCMECKEPTTYRTLDYNVILGMFFAGLPMIGVGLSIRYAF
ncbi:MAG: hypothetical protein JHC41_05035 [Nitrosopumilus sp.]|nr:hypothetical protein [Nitrosopumilus sp.]